MSKKTSIDSIRVADPCTEDWNDMAGNEQVRFCSHCSKNVNNLSAMTRTEAMRLVRDSGGRLCVRYRTDRATGAPLFAEHVSRLARHGLAAGVLSASLLSANAVYAQGGARAMPLVQIEHVEKPGTGAAKISGYVTDPNGAAIAYALVTLTNQETLFAHVQNANGEGFYEFKDLDGGKYKLRFEGGGFQTSELTDIFISEGNDMRRDGKLDLLHLQETVEVKSNSDEHVDVLVGAVDVSDSRPSNPLVTAILEGELDEVKARIMMGAKINAGDKSRGGMSPLHAAVASGNPDIAEYLLVHGAKANIRDSMKRTPLMVMDFTSDIDMLEVLIRFGAKLNLLDKEKNNLLHHYVDNGDNADVARRLASHGVASNGYNKAGVTPLMVAVENGNIDIVRALLENGADVHLRAKDGRSITEFAAGSGELWALLETYGAIAVNNAP